MKEWEEQLSKQQQQYQQAAANTNQQANAAQQPQQTQPQQPIKVMEGVTEGTQQKLNQLQSGYQPGSAAQNVQNQLQALQSSKPGGYTGQYDQQLNNILQQIKGQKPFTYSFNQDALFNSLSDLYQQQAKQAAVNAQGMAAGLTGGYGNSYAQMAGSQAYQQAILPLYDKATDLARFAYDVHQGEQANQHNQLNALLNMDQNAYGRYRDTVGDWERERDYLTSQYNTEEDRAYNRYMNDLDYTTKLAQIENADYRSEQERQEEIRQFNQQYALQREQFDYGKEQDAQQQANWQAQFDYGREQDAIANALRQAQFDYGKEQDALAQANWQAQFDYGKEQDEIANNLRQAQFDYNKAQDAQQQANWQQQFDYGREQDAIANALRQAQFDYGKEQDAQSQANWQAQFDYNKAQDAQQQANWQQQMDYQAMSDMLQQQNWQEQMNENIRQFNESLNWDKMSAQQKYAADYVMTILSNGQMPSEELLQMAGLNAADAQKMMVQIATGGGGPTKKTTNNGGMSLLDAGARDYILNPENAAQIQQYSQQANTKIVNDALRNGQLPAANNVYNAGMNQTDVMKQFMQNSAPLNPTAEELMKQKLGIRG